MGEATQDLARFAATLTYDALPERVRAHCRNVLRDTIACAVAGHRGEETGQIAALTSRDVAALTQVLVEGARLGLDLGDQQLLDRYQRWRSLDSLSVAFATDSLTRLYAVPGKTASAARRFGMGLVQRIGPLKDQFMAEARGESGDLPLLLRGLQI